MFAPPVLQVLSGDRLHLSHGPIDIVLKAWGTREHEQAANAAAWTRFQTILPELCDELPALRTPIDADPRVDGPVARRMVAACRPFVGVFVTPMAAVAGAVADELLATMRAAAPLSRAFVNDGGDIAVYVGAGETLDVGLAGEFAHGAIPAVNGKLRLESHDGIGGIATSGARGRSFSLGIADAVTTLARDAATADVAATLIANAVDVSSPAIERRRACDLDPDSDLGTRLVTVAVGPLSPAEIDLALARGAACAENYAQQGCIRGVALMLAGRNRVCGAGRLVLGGAPLQAITGPSATIAPHVRSNPDMSQRRHP